MAKEFAKSLYNSKAWRDCRQSYIDYRVSVDGGMCEECGEEIGYIVHHTILLTPDNIHDPSVSLNHEHLKYECKQCHDKEEKHFKPQIKSHNNKRYRFDENGLIIKVDETTKHSPPYL